MTLDPQPSNSPPVASSAVRTAVRCVIGGLLMGLANLVPGISGGTMLLASGVYPRFINAVSEVSRFRFRRPALIVLGLVAGSALLAIGLAAGLVKMLVLDYRWVMYSLFIGLTLGGVPVVWSLTRPATRSTWVGATVGFAAMGLLALAQSSGLGADDGEHHGLLFMFLAGISAAAAMILPGVSGGYLLLVLGVYVPILSAIDGVKVAARDADLTAATDPLLTVILPVGFGVLVGVATVSNLLQGLMARFEKTTLGVLLGLLIGAVVGLWPFQQSVRPEIGDVVAGQAVTEELLDSIDPDKYPTEYFQPTATQALSAAGLLVVGFLGTSTLARLNGKQRPARAGEDQPSHLASPPPAKADDFCAKAGR